MCHSIGGVMKAFDCRVCELPSNILVRGVNWVGDTIMALPAMKALRSMFPGANLTFWAPQSLESLLRASRIPDEIIAIPNDINRMSRPFIMSSILKKKRFDMAVLFQNAFESAFTAWLARVPLRVGYPTDGRGPLLNVKVPLTEEIRQKHQVHYYRKIVNHLGDYFGINSQFRAQSPDCSIFIGRELKQAASSLLSSLCTDLESRPLVCLCPGSVNSDAKRWPADYFVELANLLITEFNAVIIFMGATSEHPMIQSIINETGRENVFNLAGETDLEKSLGVMNLSDLVISNDTGSAHLAVAAGAKTLTIFGPTIPGATAPFGKNARIIRGKSGCSPCRHFSCPLPDHPCMRSIKPTAVIQEASKMIIKPERSVNAPSG